ncbi:hypothetical protein [Streptomyces sp. NPDC007905]|uniref:hypothetical protein n=1 Tax=Streptomyces sp. NPDC007905 TaxID=3364788 RepID=UPI0036EB3D49
MAVSDERRSPRREGRGERLVTALDQRLPVSSAGREFLRKAFPDHWSLPPGVMLPAVLSLYGYPFFERWLTGPGPEQHLCDRLRSQPTRTALGPTKRARPGLQAADRRRLPDGRDTAEVRRTADGVRAGAHAAVAGGGLPDRGARRSPASRAGARRPGGGSTGTGTGTGRATP